MIDNILGLLLAVIIVATVAAFIFFFLISNPPTTEKQRLMRAIPEGCVSTEIGKLLIIDCGLKDEVR